MKLEFLGDISEGGRFPQVVSNHLVRLYDFDEKQATRLRDIISKDILTEKKFINLSSLDFIQPLNCDLAFRISDKDEGLITQDKMIFICALTIPAYERMVELIEPFCKEGASGYQWLYDLDCAIDLLFSPRGTW